MSEISTKMLSVFDQLAEVRDEQTAQGVISDTATICSREIEITLCMYEPSGDFDDDEDDGEALAETLAQPRSSSFLVSCVLGLWALAAPFIMLVGFLAIWLW